MKLNTTTGKLSFPKSFAKDWRIDLVLILREYKGSHIYIDCREWNLNCKDINELQNICKRKNIEIISLESTIAESIISASCLGIQSFLKAKNDTEEISTINKNITPGYEKSEEIFFHTGTLRSGEVLEVDNDLLILGDVNPGAIVLAGGDVMIWGRLRGIAHAGKNGNINARISALQLRPVQLRIADKIARGPQEKPEEGLAEEATIEKDMIVIKPARTN